MQNKMQAIRISNIIQSKSDQKIEFSQKKEKKSLIKSDSNSSKLKRKYFSEKEDELLIDAILKYKKESWNDIAKFVPGRSPKQCRDRWSNYLKPSLIFDPWENSDDQLLVSLVNKYGTHWSKMKNFFPNRSSNSIKNRWNFLLKNHVKVLPIENMIISALSKKTDIFNPMNENLQQSNLKFYFLENETHCENDFSLIVDSNYKNENMKNENLSANDLKDDIISFTPEELEW